jgi:very-short-patch-repair endonuclease
MQDPTVTSIDTDRSDTIARERVARLFQFVAALYEQRNPVTRQMADHEWLLRFADVPEHEAVELRTSVADDDEASEGSETPDAITLLRCSRPSFTLPPPVPDILEDWLGRDWEDFRSYPEPLESRNEHGDGGETVVIRFADDPARTAALEAYRPLWNLWATGEKRTATAAELFEKLYSLHGTMQRDGERFELVVADGILSWSRPGGGVRHPLLLKPVQLVFEPQIPEFRIVDSDAPVEFYSSVFRSMSDVDGTVVGRLRTEASDLALHPLGAADVSAFLQSVASSISSRGKYVGPSAPGPERPDPLLGRGAAFILRKRTIGFARAIDAIIGQLLKGGEISRALLNVVGIVSTDGDGEGAVVDTPSSSITDANSDETILFTKPANPQQLDIARCLERDSCVLVQGPPGTGKTHTIANLLGHLLAQGKSVLVLSHTTKALKVLREKVVEGLQPLCVSVLDSKEDDAALKASIEGIVERIGNADTGRLDREIERLAEQRTNLVGEVRRLQTAILDARLDEQREIIVGGEGIRPIDAAKEVAAGGGRHDWIPVDVVLGQSLPLTPAEIAELYRTNETVDRDDEKLLTAPLPDTIQMPNPTDFSSLCAERRELGGIDRSFRAELWNSPPDAPAERLDGVLEAAAEAAASLERMPPWTARLVEAGASLAERGVWDQLLEEIESVRADAVVGQNLIVTHTPKLGAALDLDRVAETYGLIALDVERTGKAPTMISLLMHPSWDTALRSATVGAGSKPRLPEHFRALAHCATIASRRAALRRRWEAQVEPIGGPSAASLGEEPEITALRYSPLIAGALEWQRKIWEPVEARLTSVGLAWSVLRAEADAAYPEADNAGRIARCVADVIPRVMAAERARRRWAAVDAECTRLRRLAASWPASEAVRPLRQAVDDFDDLSYRSAFAEVERLRTVTERQRRRGELLQRLQRGAPGWANEIAVRAGLHGAALPPGDPVQAWRWRQFENELNRRDQVSLPDLIRKLDQTRSELREATIELVDRKAWRRQVERITLPQRQALMGFAEAKRRIGRGTGKRAAQFARAARERMSDARSAVPVWIMPVVKAAEVFEAGNTRFDVVIIDEASQSDITGLIAFYLGKQIVVVGDDEQVSPSAVGERALEAQNLIDEMLQGIPDAQLFDGKQSLYDIAKRSFGGTICLLEHFRCVPQIIQFSNELSYGGRIKPLREPMPTDPTPSVVEFRVASDGAVAKRNEREARAVAALIMAAIEQPEYEGKSFGVISMVGDEQAYRIEEILRAMLPPTVLEARRLLSGSPAQFQGDERNVMFLSMVDTGDGTPMPMRDTRPFQQRYNVAASRAQDQMWVVHSLDRSTELKPGDLRRRLIDHAADPGAADRNKAEALKLAESAFEEAVIRRLADAGFKVVTQHKVGAYRIDIVVVGENRKRLAVECDGDRYHPIEKLKEDADRQSILERLGWTFVRIRGSRFYRDAEAALKPVFDRLATMGIEPHGGASADTPAFLEAEALLRVKARAAELIVQIDEEIEHPVVRGRRTGRDAGEPRKNGAAFRRAATLTQVDTLEQ